MTGSFALHRLHSLLTYSENQKPVHDNAVLAVLVHSREQCRGRDISTWSPYEPRLLPAFWYDNRCYASIPLKKQPCFFFCFFFNIPCFPDDLPVGEHVIPPTGHH